MAKGLVARTAAWLSWSLACLALGLAVAAVLAGGDQGPVQWKLLVLPVFFAVPGGLIGAGRPDVAIGWLMLVVALLLGGAAFGGEWASDPDRPGAAWAVWWAERFAAYVVPMVLLVLLLLPDGRLPSRRWRLPATLVIGVQVALVTAYCVIRGPAAGDATSMPAAARGLANPVGWLPASASDTVQALEPWLLQLPMLLALAAIAVRLRRGEAEVRLGLGEVLVAGGLFVALTVLGHALWPAAADVLDVAGAALLGTSITVAVLRRRLGALDVVLHLSFVYSLLTVLIGVVYVAAVALLALVDVSLPPLGQGVVTAVIALATLPVLGWLQRAVTRALYGDRGNPYAALRRLDEELSGSTSTTTALLGTACTVTSALRVPWSAVEVEGRVAEDGTRPPGARVVVRSVRDNAGHPVTVSFATWPGRRVTAGELALVDDLARQGGRTVTALLLAEALLASRQQLVTAREEERARLRRDLHDELGPTLAGLVMQLGGLSELLQESPTVAAVRVPVLEEAARSALADVRRVSRALRPPALDELGLEGALLDHAARLGLSTSRPAQALPQIPAAVEVAAYRIGAEALTNVARHARTTRAELEVDVAAGELALVVRDDGVGWTGRGMGVGVLGMRERAEELGGQLDIRTAPGRGTVVRARLPVGVGEASG